MRKLAGIILIGMYLSTVNLCFGEEKKDEWVNKAYNFKQIRTIVVHYSVSDQLKLSDADYQQLDEMLKTVFTSKNNEEPQYIHVEQAEEPAGQAADLNVKERKTNDPEKYEPALNGQLPNSADAVLLVNIKEDGYTISHIPESLEAYTEYQYRYEQIPYTDPQGRMYYVTQPRQMPVTKYRTVPAHDVRIAHAGAAFILTASQGRQEVWKTLDVREAANKDALDMMERIMVRAKDRLHKLIK